MAEELLMATVWHVDLVNTTGVNGRYAEAAKDDHGMPSSPVVLGILSVGTAGRLKMDAPVAWRAVTSCCPRWRQMGMISCVPAMLRTLIWQNFCGGYGTVEKRAVKPQKDTKRHGSGRP